MQPASAVTNSIWRKQGVEMTNEYTGNRSAVRELPEAAG